MKITVRQFPSSLSDKENEESEWFICLYILCYLLLPAKNQREASKLSIQSSFIVTIWLWDKYSFLVTLCRNTQSEAHSELIMVIIIYYLPALLCCHLMMWNVFWVLNACKIMQYSGFFWLRDTLLRAVAMGFLITVQDKKVSLCQQNLSETDAEF